MSKTEFVRMQPIVPEGNYQLLSQGAKPFPEEPWNNSLKELLNLATQADYVTAESQRSFVPQTEKSKPLDVESSDYVRAIASSDLFAELDTTVAHEVSPSRPQDIYEAFSCQVAYAKR